MTHQQVMVDGANIAYTEQTEGDKAKVSNLIAVRKKLQDMGFEPIIIVDASLRYEVDDPEQLEGLFDKQKVRQAPAETDADYFVLKMAEEIDAPVISNDTYDRYREDYSWIDERRVPLMIIEGNVTINEKQLNRALESLANEE